MTSPSADVIFVVEEKQCNADIASKLQLVATDIDEALSAARMTGNRFAVVTFGGSGIHADAQLHTVSGQVFLDSADVSKVEDSMEILDDVSTPSDALAAVQMAAELPMRAGAAKSIVLITCTGCDSTTTAVGDVTEELLAAGIQLHVVSEQDFQMTSLQNQPRANNLFGELELHSHYDVTT